MKLINFFHTSHVGFDIQEHELRLLKLRKKRSCYQVEWHLTQSMPAGICQDGKITNWNELSLLLSEIVKKNALKGQDAVIALPVSLVRMQRMQLPAVLNDIALETSIATQLQRDLPGVHENLCVDYKEFPSPSKQHKDFLIAVTRQEYINQLRHSFHAAGLKIKVIEVDIYALQRLFSGGVTDYTKMNALFLGLNGYVQLLVFSKHEIIFHQRWVLSDAKKIWFELEEKLHLFKLIHPNETIYQILYFNIDVQANNPSQMLERCDFYNPFSGPLFAKHTLLPASFMLAAGCAVREIEPW